MFNTATLFNGSHVSVLVAFLAGFITFFASCLLPLVPTYLAYLSGISLSHHPNATQKWQIFRHAALFVLGFISTFFLLGIFSYQLASTIGQFRPVVEKIAGVFFIALGLFMLGVFQHRWFTQERRLDLHGAFTSNRSLHAVLVGIAFGFGWTPCIGPVLAVILYWATEQSTVWQGAGLLLTYGVGLGVPFLLVAAGFEYLVPLLKRYKSISRYLNYVSAGLMILAGGLLFFGQFQKLSLLLLHIFDLHLLTG